MKKFFLVLVLLAMVAPVYAADSINCGRLGTNNYTIEAGESITFRVSRGSEGFFSIQPTFTGTGTLKIEYQTSTLGNYWSPVVEIIASAVSGTEYRYPATGVNIFSGNQRIILTETGGLNSVTIQEVGRCVQ